MNVKLPADKITVVAGKGGVRLLLFGAITSTLLCNSTAWAIFDYAGVPAHTGHVSWSAPLMAGGEPHWHHHHFHNTMHLATPDAQSGHDVAHELSGTRTNEPDYDPYSIWVNETYIVFDGSGGGAAQEFFSHGYIIETNANMPEYQFQSNMQLFAADGVTLFDPRPEIRLAFKTWTDLTIDDAHLTMGLAFREFAADGDAAEIQVSVVDHIVGATAAWSPANKTLQFSKYADAALTMPMKWYTGAAGGFPGNAADRRDLLDVALHEVGHIVGLDHQTDTDDIMIPRANGVNLRSLSGDDILGARDLYSLPIPEPSALGILCIVATLFGGVRRR